MNIKIFINGFLIFRIQLLFCFKSLLNKIFFTFTVLILFQSLSFKMNELRSNKMNIKFEKIF